VDSSRVGRVVRVSAVEVISCVRLGYCSHIGYRRSENQDRMVSFQTDMGELFVVADGMGGHRGGATAATMVVEGFERNLRALPPGFTPRAALRAAARRTNAEICSAGEAGDPATAKMGSTVVILFVSRSQVFVGHIGDSRAYLFRQGHLSRLTRDHTLVQHLVDRGLITEEEARDHPDASVLARAMGRRSDLDIEFSSNLTLDEGDSVLLCSDGLSGYVDDPEIGEVLAQNRDPQAAAEALVEAALATGGYDNITVHVVTLTRRIASASRGMRVAKADGPGMPDDGGPAPAPLLPGSAAAEVTSDESVPSHGLARAEWVVAAEPPPEPRARWGRPWWVTPALLAGAGLVIVALTLTLGAYLLPGRRLAGEMTAATPAQTGTGRPSSPPSSVMGSARSSRGERFAVLLVAGSGEEIDELSARLHTAGLQAKVVDRDAGGDLAVALHSGTVYYQDGYDTTAAELARALGFTCLPLPDTLVERCRRPIVIVAARRTTAPAQSDRGDVR
jgi:PPM family protein phosphatase